MDLVKIFFSKGSYFFYLFCSLLIVLKFSACIEGNLAPSIKRKLASWLRNYEAKSVKVNWLYLIRRIFNIVFGKTPLSTRFIIRSFLASTLFFLFLICIWSSLNSDKIVPLINEYSYVLHGIPNKVYIQTIFFLLINFVADYLSLIETRFILLTFATVKSVWSKIALLLVDILATSLVFLLCFTSYWYSSEFSNYFISPAQQALSSSGKMTILPPDPKGNV